MHYLVAVFANPIAAELGWSVGFVQAGFSLGLVVMGLASYRVGSWIDRHGGRAAMMAGVWCGAAGCLLLAATQREWQFLLAWVLLGLGMRLALYDAAFATLAHAAGPHARRAMSLITLFGGFASTVFWPLGQALVTAFGWRAALAVYALLLVLSSLLHLALPRSPANDAPAGTSPPAPAGGPPPRAIPGARLLYGFLAVGVMFLQTGMAAHLLVLLQGLGWTAASAVGLATLFGLGQFTGRMVVVLWAHRMDPVRLNLVPAALQCLCFACYLAAGGRTAGAAAFAFLYGAGNGIATITRGAMPLVLFDPARYGRTVGAILKPAFALAATAPVALAWAIGAWGARGAIQASLALAAAMLLAAIALLVQVQRSRRIPTP